MNTITINAEVREGKGKKASKDFRRAGQVPCVMYGGKENVHFTADALSLGKVVYTPNFYMVDLNVGGSTHKAIVKDMQFHPVTDRILHMDFQELVDDRKVIVNLPLVFEGLAVGVKEGGKLLPKMRKLKVKAFPNDLIDSLKVDVSHVELGKSVKVGELEYNNLEIMNSPNAPVCSVDIPRALKSAASEEAAAEGAEVAEGAEAEGAEG